MGQMCNEERNGPHCYIEASWIETYMNLPSTKRGLGIPMSRKFEACDTKISEATIARGQWMRDSSRHLPGLMETGVRVLVYNGNADFVCNYMVHPLLTH
jgi:cathepsin A (carboxypeptidase C)